MGTDVHEGNPCQDPNEGSSMSAAGSAGPHGRSPLPHTPLPAPAEAGHWSRQWSTALRCFDLDAGRFEVSLLAYAENATYDCRDRHSGERLVLRLHRPGVHQLVYIRSELAWIDALRRDRAVHAPGFRMAAPAEAVARFRGPEGQMLHAALFEHLPGREPAAEDLPGAMALIGAQTARLHAHARGWNAPRGFDRPIWNVDHLIGDTAPWGCWGQVPEARAEERTHRLLEQAESKIRNELAAYGTGRDRFGLIHADLRTANLLVDGSRTAVIDFDDCGTGWFMYDLACTLSFREDDARLPSWVAAWLRGYTGSAELGREDLAVLPSMLMLRRLQLLARGGARRQPAVVDGRFVPATAALAERYLDGGVLADLAA